MEDSELFVKRANSFGSQAGAYAEHRPDYPADGIRWAIAGAARPVRRVLDLGAGTGKLTGGLLTLGYELVAVEPDESMLAELSHRFPQVTALMGTAERTGLADGSVDAVLAGQAFHWFDADRALSEIARVLRPGGVVGAMWNSEDETVEWVAGMADEAHSSASRWWLYSGQMPAPPAHPAFEPFERAEFRHAYRHTAESLTAAVGTHSHTLVISAAERTELLGRVRRYLDSRPETAHGEFDMPLRTTVFRARLRPRSDGRSREANPPTHPPGPRVRS